MNSPKTKYLMALVLLAATVTGYLCIEAGHQLPSSFGTISPAEQATATAAGPSPSKPRSQPQLAPSVLHHESLQSCPSAEAGQQQFQHLLQKKEQLQQQLRPMLAAVEPVFIQHISHRYQLQRADISPQAAMLMPPEAQNALSTAQELKAFQPLLNLAKAQRYTDISALLTSGELAPDATIEQQLLLHWILKLNPGIDSDSLQLLLNAQLKVSLDTLYLATSAGLAPAKLQLLSDHLAGSDIGIIWYSGGQNISLASFAAQLNRPDIARFWWQQGSPLVDTQTRLNVAMQIPWQQLENADIHAFVSLLTTALPTPIELAPAHYQWLASRLTAEQLSLFVPSYALASEQPFWQQIDPLLQQLQQVVTATARLAGCHLSIARQLQYQQMTAHGGSRQRWFERWQAIQQATQQTSNHNYTDLETAIASKQWQQVLQQLAALTPASDHTEIYSLAYFSLLEAAVDLHIYNQFINLYSTLPDYLLLGATGHGQLQLAALLLKRGANVNAKNQRGETALQLAVYTAELNGPQMIEFLLAAGAQPVLGSADAFRTLLLRSHQHDLSRTAHCIALFRQYGIAQPSQYHSLITAHPQLSEAQKQTILSWL